MSDPLVADGIYKTYFGSSYGVEPVLATEESIIEAIRKVYAYNELDRPNSPLAG